MSNWTRDDVKRVVARQQPKARAKYGSVKTTVDAIEFDSKREAARYSQLKLMQQAGHITDLRWQPRYTLFALTLELPDLHNANAGFISSRRQPVCDYIADFEYHDVALGRRVVEDVKSPATKKKEVYRLKRKLFEGQYGIQIQEIA